ncbi:hypothetical protein BDFB_008194 [Asbolus verrucosus]|uniref:Uncharacterized protein n=1 Tax=Asbolus verrucosus TaxID=1661398 RepID=A0A482W7K7_ASBVE|nr:hypothetical protein BDFB_008194 [Asbolus verrucosus]
MKRNRNIRTLPLDNLALFKHPPPEASQEKLYFGEEIPKDNSPIFERTHILSSDDSLDTILTGLKDLSTGKSSSSSLSWGDEYKSEASKQVRNELERMDRVLQGLEPIPPNYDEEEYKEWMEFFPNLCILGSRFGRYTEEGGDFCYVGEEILAIHPEDGCDKVETPDQIKTKIKKAVIDQIYEKIANNAPKITLNLNDSIDIDSYLKISPLGGSSSRERIVRRQSSRSLMSSQISSSKWLKEEGEYNSLPFLVKSERNGAPKSILKNSLVLPPIETSQFRSISATPRRESKSMSALSVNDRLETTSKFLVVKNSGFKRKSGRENLL